jgi:hypothetical protein
MFDRYTLHHYVESGEHPPCLNESQLGSLSIL